MAPGPIIRMVAITTLLAACLRGQAQSDQQVQAMTTELCACMATVDLKQNDRTFDGQVRRCLEDAVVHHPSAVRRLISQQQGDGSKGYQIGVVLGRALGRGCKAFAPVQERLRRINAASPLLKSTS